MHSYKRITAIVDFKSGLNPCFNGRCTRTDKKMNTAKILKVLILVLMEDALVQIKK